MKIPKSPFLYQIQTCTLPNNHVKFSLQVAACQPVLAAMPSLTTKQHLLFDYLSSLCILSYYFINMNGKWKSDRYDSSGKHRFKKATVLPTESGRSFTLVLLTRGG